MNGSQAGHRGVRSDPGCYEERYRLASAVLSLAPCLLALGLGLLWHTHLIWAVLTFLLAIPVVIAAALRPVAFRADRAGIMLGSVRPLSRRPAVFVPWADVEQIVVYEACRGGLGDQIWCLGIVRREGAPALPWGNEQAPDCPVPGVAAGATRRITSWRLDRARLAAVTAAAAPGVPVVLHRGVLPARERAFLSRTSGGSSPSPRGGPNAWLPPRTPRTHAIRSWHGRNRGLADHDLRLHLGSADGPAQRPDRR